MGLIIWWLVWRKAHASEVARLTIGAGGFFVLLAGAWLWLALQNRALYNTVPYAVALMAAGSILGAIGWIWYTRAKQQESRDHVASFP